MKPDRDQDTARDLSDTLIRHRAILENRSTFGQGLQLLKIAFVMAFLYVKFKFGSWLDAHRSRNA